MTLKEAYSYSVQFLTRNGVEEADFKALCLCCHLTGITNSQYAAHQADELMPGPLAKMLWRVKEGEPLQYVLGSWDFYESEFQVGRGVLIPRPETEELVALALKTAEAYAAPVVVDLCAGSGCIGVSIAKKRRDSRVFCVEKSADAFVYLEKNAASCENVTAVLGDLRDELPVLPADLLVSNPPYIKSALLPTLQKEVQYEPLMALDGGSDGLDFYRWINALWAKRLKPGGVLLLEIGDDQGSTVPALLTNFKDIEVRKDLYGNDRMVLAYVK